MSLLDIGMPDFTNCTLRAPRVHRAFDDERLQDKKSESDQWYEKMMAEREQRKVAVVELIRKYPGKTCRELARLFRVDVKVMNGIIAILSKQKLAHGIKQASPSTGLQIWYAGDKSC